MEQTTEQQKISVKEIDTFNSFLLDHPALMVIMDEDNKKPFAIVSPKKDESDFIPAILKAISEEKDCTCSIHSAEIVDYGYTIELQVSMSTDDDQYIETFYGFLSVSY